MILGHGFGCGPISWGEWAVVWGIILGVPAVWFGLAWLAATAFRKRGYGSGALVVWLAAWGVPAALILRTCGPMWWGR